MSADLRALNNLARAASAGEGDVAALLARLCASLAESFGFDTIDAWRYFPDTGQVLLLTSDHQYVDSLDEHPAMAAALASGRSVCVDGSLAIPLVSADRVLGFLRTDNASGELARSEAIDVAGSFVAAVLQRSLAREELERLSRLKSQFIALASHELRAPAAVIHGVAKTVAARAERIDGQQLHALHATLVQHTERLTRLIDELLDLSRLEAKAIAIDRRPLPVRPRIVELVQSVAGERRDEVVVDVPADLEPHVDATAFDRIVGNLVTNALRYGRTPISIRAVQNDRHFRLSVEDQGDGVAPAFVPKLFDRFSRGVDSGSAAGSGLGLSIAQAYAQAHGGQLFYEDASPHGARFQLVLPAH
jgi:two-component system, OmpR family, sensor histidine kinase MtrB